MTLVVDIVVAVLLLGGCFFALTAGVGMLRFPDFYTRLHPAGMTDTLGQAMVLLALTIMVIVGPPMRGGDAAAADGAADHAEHAQTQPDGAVAHGHGAGAPKPAGNVTPDWGTAVKLVLIFVFLTITCPTSTHAITRAAHLARLQPWMNDEARANAAKAVQSSGPAVPPGVSDAPPETASGESASDSGPGNSGNGDSGKPEEGA